MPPPGCYCQVAGRSGLAVKGIDVGAGVIDPDYRGVVHVLLCNRGESAFHVRRGDRMAQLIVHRVATPAVREADLALAHTARGAAGFGSTGLTS